MRNVNMTADEPDPAARPTHAADTGPTGPAPGSVTAEAESAADQAVTALYATHYRPLVRLATLLVGDADTAAEVAEDAFVAMHGAWRWLRDRDKALSYLRQSVVKGSRSALRHAAVADPKTPERAVAMPGAGQEAITRERSMVISALRALPPRQREAVVLRFYLDLSEEQAASAMGIGPGAVRNHTARAMAALPGVLKL